VRSLIPHSEEVFGCDTVVVAIGQSSDLSFINESDNIQVARGDTIVVDPETMATTAPGVYAGGDVAFGPSIIIDAVRDGHIATRSIDQYIQGGRATVASRGWMEEVSSSDLPPTDNLNIPRHRAPGLDLDRRTGTIETENVYSEETAVEQASRCLKCHIQTVFNGDLCILCGGCVDVCPRNCYKMVSIDRIEGSQRLDSLVKARFGISLQSLLLQYREDKGASDRGTAMIKDEDRCMRCGLCAERCPVGAITMESFRFEEELVYVTDAEGQKANVGGSH
jgi:ferredoxin